MSRLTISLALASMILTLGVPEQEADACGVKLAIKTTRQRARAKQSPVAASDREVVARRAARAPVAVGPAAPRITIKTKQQEPTNNQAAQPTGPTTVARVDAPAASKTLTANEPTKATPPAPPPTMKEPVKATTPAVAKADTPPAKDATVKDTTPAKPATVAKADTPPPTKVTEPPRKKKKKATAAVTKQVEPKNETPIVLDAEVFYGLGQTTSDDNAHLDDAVKWLTVNSKIHATIEGYADPQGWADRNMMISRMRAEAAMKYLVDHGIDATRLEIQAFGDTKLKYERDDIRNRRVAVEAKR